MATTHFSGKVDSVAGFSVNGTTVVSSAGTVTSQTSIVVGSTTISEAEIGVLDAVSAGTAAASKAAVLGTNKNLDTLVIADGGLKLGSGAGTAVNATAAEINQHVDDSARVETIAAAGALSTTVANSKLALSGAGAVTLAAPDATMLGRIKHIEMTVDTGDVTLALTNVEGQSSGTTATFNDVGDKLILIGGTSKWTVLKEFGIILA